MVDGTKETDVITIEKENISPYLSILVVSLKNKSPELDFHQRIIDKFREGKSELVTLGKTKSDSIGEIGNLKFTPYNLMSTPTWLIGVNANNLERHVLISIIVKDYAAVYFSQKGMKDQVREWIEENHIDGVDTVDSSILNNIFVNEDKVKMLWLSGTHGRETFKADSKVVGGESVVDTLDPLLDQSYFMSAARTEVELDTRSASLGVNPGKSSIWRGRCFGWEDFESKVVKLLDLINENTEGCDSPISILSYPVSNCNDVSGAYDFCILDPEALPEKGAERDHHLLEEIWENYSIEVDEGVHGEQIYINIKYLEEWIGSTRLRLSMSKRKVKFEKIDEHIKQGKKGIYEKFMRVFSHLELIKCWFSSGHALVGGMLFRTGYRDVRYEDFVWSKFDGYDIEKEKPYNSEGKVDLTKIGYDNSLFCWVKNRWSGAYSNIANSSQVSNRKGWLYCDDGSGEKADFIHLAEVNGTHYLSLIHVKSAHTDSKDRRISVGAHDVVLSQAVKNLRYCSRKKLAVDLEARKENSQNKMCWHNDKSCSPDDFLSTLRSLEDNNELKIRVVVIQPHTRKKYYEGLENRKSTIRCQLDVLLVSARVSIRSAGADFFIIGCDDS